MYSSPRIRYHSLRRRPSAYSPPSRHDLVDHVERDQRVGVRAERAVVGAEVLRDGEDVGAQPVAEDRLALSGGRERLAGVVLEEPRRRLAVPHQHVAVDPQVVVPREVHERRRLGRAGAKLLSASYQASGFMWFSGVIWSKWRVRSSAAAPDVSRLSIATPTGKSVVSLMPVRSSITGGSPVATRTSSTRIVYGVSWSVLPR